MGNDASKSDRTEIAPLDNAALAELLAREAMNREPPLKTALRRASRRAFLWPEEAHRLIDEGRSLQELSGIGPHLERLILAWMDRPEAVTPPEIRRGFLTYAQVRTTLDEQPSWRQLLKGDLQMHTAWSDGSGSIREMAEAAAGRGYEYIAITDHSKGLKIAHGIDEDQLRQQFAEIEAVNQAQRAAGGVHVLRSIELNLNPTGEGDMPFDSLAELDIVLACFHSALRRTEDQTERYELALRNPTIHILGHPRGRIYNHRLGLNADWPRVFGLAAKLDKAIEIDCYPDRQDLSVDLARLAAKEGCRISLATDAHDPSQLAFIEFGLAAAILAEIPPERVLNFLTRSELLAWVSEIRTANSA